MAIKYIYIDDSEERNGIAVGLSVHEDKLQVEAVEPKNWQSIRTDIEQQGVNGILLDWNLQGNLNTSDYSSVALAQELRELARQGTIKDIPIILCSAQTDFNIKYDKDATSHNLFDVVYDKETLTGSDSNSYIYKFISLSKGYQILNQAKTISSILKIENTDFESLDIRFQEEINNLLQSPSHEIARFILRQVIEYQGILIDEAVLAARLGIDKEKSKDWNKLKETLSSYKYQGVFGDAWERWWWFGVEKWWNTIAPDTHLQTNSASNRVKLISDKTKTHALVPAQKLKYTNSDEFWAVCAVLHKPIDIMDGFILDKKTHYTWQEREYISNEAIISSEYKLQVDVLERKRLHEFKEYIKSTA
jgi:hypothetical protein